jgi:hypothetical protein
MCVRPARKLLIALLMRPQTHGAVRRMLSVLNPKDYKQVRRQRACAASSPNAHVQDLLEVVRKPAGSPSQQQQQQQQPDEGALLQLAAVQDASVTEERSAPPELPPFPALPE